MEEAKLKLLKDLHRMMFKEFDYETDMEKYGHEEYWDIIPEEFKAGDKFSGDCENFALACRKVVRGAGFESRLIFCTLKGQGHCVLEVDGYIFDNRFETLSTKNFLEKKGYKWIAISGFKAGDKWHKLEDF